MVAGPPCVYENEVLVGEETWAKPTACIGNISFEKEAARRKAHDTILTAFGRDGLGEMVSPYARSRPA